MTQRRVALVTGCSDTKGLGAALCRQLLKDDFEVYATGRSLERTKFLETEGCIVRTQVLQLDIADEASVKAVQRDIESRSGRLDLLINNAAIVASAPLLDMDPQAFRQHFENNVFGTFNMIQAFGPLLVRTANSSGADGPPSGKAKRTSMVNIGSVQVAFGMPWMGAYGASKAAVQTMTDSLRKEMKPLGVNVINVELCGVKTPFTLGQRPPANPISSTPSGFYDKFVSFQPKLLEGFNKSGQGAQDPEAAAKDIVRAAIAPRSPPLKMWAGAPGWLFKYIFGVLPVSFFEGMLMKEHFVNEIAAWKARAMS